MQPQIIVVGSHAPGLFMRIRRMPVPGETVIGWDYSEPIDGGKGTNQAIAAARLEARVSFMGCIGDDRIERNGETWLCQDQVDITYLRRNKGHPTGVGFILLDDSGIPAMVTSMEANSELDVSLVEHAIRGMDEAKVLLTQFEIDPSVALYAARIAHEHGMITIVNPSPVPDRPLPGLEFVDILILNEIEARILLGLKPDAPANPCDLAEALIMKYRSRCVMLTIGKRGVVFAYPEGTKQISPPDVKTVDTSGAGDAFCAAVAVDLVEGMTPLCAAEWACCIAALSVTRPGTIPSYPQRKEEQEFLLALKART